MVGTLTTLPEDDLGPDGLVRWLGSLPAPTDEAVRRRLADACRWMAEGFDGQKERTGQPVILYALHVADILARLGMDDETLMVAVLHRLVSAGIAGQDEIIDRFGEEIGRLVANVVRIDRLVPGALAARETTKGDMAESLRRMVLDISDDARVLLLLLAERLHLMRRLRNLPPDIQERYSRNTRDIYAPIANRLGIWQIKWELEDLSLRFLEPEDYRDIACQLDGRRQARLDYIANVTATLREAFQREGIEADISGRPKHIYSIWRKMRRKDVDFSRVFDVRALRVLVGTVAECYGALGVVHSLWRHIPGEFDDYIATPKANAYQSIHTVVIGPEEKPLEIQIRTRDMHEHAERGIAAHWRYKEQRGSVKQLDQRIKWLRQWLESRSEGEAEPIADQDADDEASLVYVLTPQGKVIELPFGATPVDFAYAVHSEVGHRCRGAKVDGRIVPLTYRLESGSTVEILTTKEGGPSRDWLRPSAGYVRSPRARQSIRQWFKLQDFEKHLGLGRAALERELGRQNRDRPKLGDAASRFSFRTADDLLAAIGRGDLSVGQVASLGALRQVAKSDKSDKAITPTEDPQRRSRRKPRATSGGQVRVQGVDDLLTTLGKCCRPVPGDPIVGYITRGRGVTVHRTDCPIIAKLSEDEQPRLADVMWIDDQQEAVYAVDIHISADDRKGLLRDITSVFSNEDVAVTDVKTHSDQGRQRAHMSFTVQVSGTPQLEHLMEKLLQVPDVNEVRRGR